MATVPALLRSAVREQLDRLVAGDLPELLTWVHGYGSAGAALVAQPEAVWSHPRTEVVRTGDGWHVVLPLWTTQESPSDLSAQVLVAADGTAEVHDVRVL